MKYLSGIYPILCGLLISLHSSADAPAATQTQLEAVFLYNFSTFIEWPDSAFSDEDSPFNICVVGGEEDDEFNNALDVTVETEYKTETGRKLEVMHFDDDFNPQDSKKILKSCQIVFISNSLSEQALTIIDTIQDQPILTVSDTSEFTQDCGMIEFQLSGEKIGLLMHHERMKKVNLEPAAPLLELVELDEDTDCDN